MLFSAVFMSVHNVTVEKLDQYFNIVTKLKFSCSETKHITQGN